jgi:hypothetical protein
MSVDRALRVLGDHLLDSDARMPPAQHRWLAPVDVRLDGDALVYDHRATRRRGCLLVPSPGMLAEFLTLADASDHRIAAYAERYGVIGLCPHGLVHTHCTRLNDDGEPHVDNPSDREPLDLWRRWSRLAWATVDVATRVRRGKWDDASNCQLRELVEYGMYGWDVGDWRDGFRLGRYAVAAVCSRWLIEGDARLIVHWPEGRSRPEIVLGAPVADAGAFTGIGLQLAMACASSEGLTTCDGCGAVHAPSRQPRPGQRTFCARCRADNVPVKLANRDRRARERAAKAKQQRS